MRYVIARLRRELMALYKDRAEAMADGMGEGSKAWAARAMADRLTLEIDEHVRAIAVLESA